LKNSGFFKNNIDEISDTDDDDDDDDDDDINNNVTTIDGYMHVESHGTMLTLMNPIHEHNHHQNNNIDCDNNCNNTGITDEITDDNIQDDNNDHHYCNDIGEAGISMHRPKGKTYTHGEVIHMAMYIAPFWFMANCLYYYSLEWTSVSSSTIIRYKHSAVH